MARPEAEEATSREQRAFHHGGTEGRMEKNPYVM